MKKSILVVLTLCAAHAAAQTSGPQPVPAPPPERKAPESRPPLNLKLDQPARMYVQEEPRDKSTDNLPTLGGGSLNFERKPRDLRPEARGTYPMDTENANR
jgi:hypothetical protein